MVLAIVLRLRMELSDYVLAFVAVHGLRGMHRQSLKTGTRFPRQLREDGHVLSDLSTCVSWRGFRRRIERIEVD